MSKRLAERIERQKQFGKMKELLAIYPISSKTVQRWCNRNDDQFPHMKVNGRYYFDLLEVRVWMQRHGYGCSEAS